LGTHEPLSQRCVLAQVPQNCLLGPQASMPLFGAHEPSGRQHDEAQVHVTGPASTGPASTTGAASQAKATQRSLDLHATHLAPPVPHSRRAAPSTHSARSVQQPLHVDALHGRVQPAKHSTTISKHHRMCAAL
jgi:hypothetical protein